MRRGASRCSADPSRGDSASELLRRADADELETILRDLGEERFARRIAAAIVAARAQGGLATTSELAELVARTVPGRERHRDPATRTFQALRIAVNDELDPLDRSLEMLVGLLKPQGRLCVISFHSLEDRIVKNTFRRLADPCECPKHMPVCVCGKKPVVRLVPRKPVTASDEELSENPRARSATLRIAEKLP